MAISGDYPKPVTVNGFQCKNCTEVDMAKRHVDPAHPRSGPYQLNAAADPTISAAEKTKLDAKKAKTEDAVNFGGSLSYRNDNTISQAQTVSAVRTVSSSMGTRFDKSA
ncbi:hypothetical protein [Devosia sp.]|uniref:hypothetical protein n=1 Tax=Devosia sp. TaxID=1871048 RepID=UPI003265BA33